MSLRPVERRTRRSPETLKAVNLCLETLRMKRNVDTLSLTTTDGVLIAGAGPLDHAWIGALGAEKRSLAFEWGEHTLHAHGFDVNDEQLWLTTAGAPINDSDAIAGLMRILAN